MEEDNQENIKNKEPHKTLVFCTRGITQKGRHLMEDLRSLIPNSAKEKKLDKKMKVSEVSIISELAGCNATMFFECRKDQDLYLYLSLKNGPTMKAHLSRVHTMKELHFTGNCLKGSRPILSFDSTFESEPKWALIRNLLQSIFATPKGHKKSKPFIDHVISFSIADDRIWFRHYQIGEQKNEDNHNIEPSLIEIGPRFVMEPIKIFEGDFGGSILYQNGDFVHPSILRQEKKRKLYFSYRAEKQYREKMSKKKEDDKSLTPVSQIDKVFEN